MAWVENILKLTELKARYFLVIWILGALLIFLPLNIKEQMGLATLPTEIQPWLGLITLAAFALWLAQLFHSIQNWFQYRSRRSEILSQLDTLSRGERDILIQCLANNQRTIRRNIADSDTHSLTSKLLLVRAGGVGSALSWPHTIPKFVWDYIKKNEAELFPELFDENAMREFQQRQQHGWMRR